MKCPVCTDVDLLMTDRQGIEIDYCSRCRGVWLDRGELDKIIERSAAPAPAPAASTGRPPQADYGDERRDHRHTYGVSEPYRKKKKGGLLGELFDF